TAPPESSRTTQPALFLAGPAASASAATNRAATPLLQSDSAPISVLRAVVSHPIRSSRFFSHGLCLSADRLGCRQFLTPHPYRAKHAHFHQRRRNSCSRRDFFVRLFFHQRQDRDQSVLRRQLLERSPNLVPRLEADRWIGPCRRLDLLGQ